MNDVVARALCANAEGVGLVDPEPVVLDIGGPLREIARTLAGAAQPFGLYRWAGSRDYLTVALDGSREPMSAERLASWAEKPCLVVKEARGKGGGDPEEKPGKKSAKIDVALARRLMACDDLAEGTRELSAVFDVSLPVWADRERSGLRLLSPGYDDASKVLTLAGVEYDRGLAGKDGLHYLMKILHQYPWHEAVPVGESRSFAAQVTLMLGEFGRLLLPDKARPPLGLWVANQPGSGKSTLARMVISPVHGEVRGVTLPERGEELRKLLSSAAFGAEPVLFFDDVKALTAGELANFVAGSGWSDRGFHQQRMISARQRTSVFSAANDPKLSPDIERRSLTVDLFAAESARERQAGYQITIDEGWIAAEENRRDILAALWSLLRNWEEKGFPRHGESSLPSFEWYSRTFGSAVMCAGLVNPFSPRESSIGGDERGRAIVELLRAAAETIDAGGNRSFSSVEFLDLAEERGISDLILSPTVKDPAKSLGKALSKQRGRRYSDGQGRQFQFAGRDQTSTASYTIHVEKGGGH